jgi:FG-GAP-like repeat
VLLECYPLRLACRLQGPTESVGLALGEPSAAGPRVVRTSERLPIALASGMISPVKAWVTATLAAGALLGGASSAQAAFVTEAGSPYAVGAQPYSVYSSDFNGDGRPDVAAVNGTSSDVSVYLRNAAGGFTQEAGSPFAGGPGNGSAAVADFDGNGLPDLFTTNFVANTFSVLLAQPGGTFTPQAGSPFQTGAGPQAAVAGDLNNDGRPDVVLSLYNGNQVTVLANTANGFTFQQTIPGGGQPSTPVIADFDGDGARDFAFINTSGSSVTVVRQTAAAGYAVEQTIPLPSAPAGITTGDFDGNGRPDLAVTRAGDPGSVTVLLRNATNSGFNEAPYSPIAVSATPANITTADLNIDGRPDLALAANSSAIDVLENTGSGFTRTAIPMSASAQNGIAAADFNADGRPDLVASEYGGNTFSVLINEAPATPPPPPPPPTPTPTPTPRLVPVAGVNLVGAPKSGTVLIKRPGSKAYVRIAANTAIPVGSTIDARKGRVTITADEGGGKLAVADFYDGIFKVTQSKTGTRLTTLTLVEKLSCPARGKRSSASASAKKKGPSSRKLWGDGKGSFQTKGEYSAATVRGTKWLVQDTCSTTLTRVARGVVSVRDFVKDKTVTVRAGKSYTARRKR